MNSATMLLFTSNLFIALGMSFLFWKHWLPTLRPDWFYIFNIFEHDFTNFKQHKIFLPISKEKDSYSFSGCEYDKSNVKPYINSNGVYTWNFKKGQNKPVVFYGDIDSIDGNLINQIKKFSMDDIWASDSGFQNFIQTWGLIIMAIVVLVLFYYLINQNQQTTKVLLNLTRRWG